MEQVSRVRILVRFRRIMDTSPMGTSPNGHFACWTLCLLDISPTVWSFHLMDTSHTRHFIYGTVRLLIGHFAYKTLSQFDVRSIEAIRLKDCIHMHNGLLSLLMAMGLRVWHNVFVSVVMVSLFSRSVGVCRCFREKSVVGLGSVFIRVYQVPLCGLHDV